MLALQRYTTGKFFYWISPSEIFVQLNQNPVHQKRWQKMSGEICKLWTNQKLRFARKIEAIWLALFARTFARKNIEAIWLVLVKAWALSIEPAHWATETTAYQQPIRAHKNLNFFGGSLSSSDRFGISLILMSEFQAGERNRTNQNFFKWNPWIS